MTYSRLFMQCIKYLLYLCKSTMPIPFFVFLTVLAHDIFSLLRQSGSSLITLMGQRAPSCTIWSAVGPYQKHCAKHLWKNSDCFVCYTIC